MVFFIPGPLREQTGGRAQVRIDAGAGTLGEALAALWREYPGLRDRMVNEQGEVRQHVNIFIGDENMRDCGGF
ncbi:MAG: MoaD/ThiS family protein [Acidobacteria bacterium]|nr:MoaD/ThiS family protein [Acidobacteriota bacterium]